MQLSKIRIKNYRLLIDAELDVDVNTTLIVGRNNTAKTSCFDCISRVLQGKAFSYDDYPLVKRENLYDKILKFMKKEIAYSELCEQLDIISIEFFVDYSLDAPEDNLGALSPFIIDVDMDTTTALIRVEYALKVDEQSLYNLLKKSCYIEDEFQPNTEDVHDIIISNFEKLFEITIYAVNEKNPNDKQIKTQNELKALFPYFAIPAERTLGEAGSQSYNSLGKLISTYFDVSKDALDPSVPMEILKLRNVVNEANKGVQKQSNDILSKLVRDAVGFGYPNGEELLLGVTTQLNIDDQIKNQSVLSYSAGETSESLPSSHNGLGYKNLIKIQFLLAAFARELTENGGASIPLLFIEEPESHMHPQMQQTFAEYLGKFLEKISNVHIQTFLTSHSAHVANTIDFSQIRYAQKSKSGVIYKNLDKFAHDNADNMSFIKKYLTLSRCDLFFADKIIFVEGASERLLVPDMINKCNEEGLFNNQTYCLPAQYYALIEIGGAYAHKFIPFADFLEIPCLILTDIDSAANNNAVPVSQGETTSNATIKWWMRYIGAAPENGNATIRLADVRSLTNEQKTSGKCHIEFQTEENGLCGRSLEESIKNANREIFHLEDITTDGELIFKDKCKTDFALNLICNNDNYVVPHYIKEGLIWLNNQKVLE